MEFSITADFSEYKKVFLEENAKLNLVSKNDEKVLFEKHIYDSIAIKLFFEKYKIKLRTRYQGQGRRQLPDLPMRQPRLSRPVH